MSESGSSGSGEISRRDFIKVTTGIVGGLIGVVIGVPAIALASVITPWVLLLYVVGAALYLKRPYQRVIPMMRGTLAHRSERIKAIGWVPVIRVMGDLAKMIGYPAGVRWRWQNRRRQVS